MTIEIPDAAVEAAVSVIYDYDAGQHYSKEATATKLLEAAYPHLVAAAKREVLAELRERGEKALAGSERLRALAPLDVQQSMLEGEIGVWKMALSFIGDAERMGQ